MANKTKAAVIEAIRSRLNDGIASGQPLYGVKRIRVGANEESRHQNDLPIINIRLINGAENPNYQNHAVVDHMQIEITLICQKLSQTTGQISANSLFKTSDGTGAINILDSLLNVLDLNSSGSIDLTFGKTVKNRISTDYSIDEANDSVVITVQIVLETKAFISGAR